MSEGIVGLIGVVIGGLIAAIPGIIIFVGNKRAEDRRHLREMGYRLALIKFETVSKEAAQGSTEMGFDQNIPALEEFVLDGIKFMDIIANGGLTEKEMADRIRGLKAFNAPIFRDHRKKQ